MAAKRNKVFNFWVNYALDKLDVVAVAAYGLASYDRWVAWYAGSLTVVDGGMLALYSVGLVAYWAAAGFVKAKVAE